MRILLITPSYYDARARLVKTRRATMPSLATSYLAAMVPAGHAVTIIDEAVEPVDFGAPVDLVGISTTTPNATRAYEIADAFRERGVHVVLGGIHASAVPEEAAEHADAVVVGEAEDSWPEAVRDFEAGCLEKTYRRPSRESLESLPTPRFDLLDHSKYRRFPLRKTATLPIQSTRGCPYNCDFCLVTRFWGKTIRHRPVADVVAEINESKADSFAFVDDNFFAEPAYSRELMEALVPLDIKYICQLDTTVHRHPELVQLASKSGCVLAFVGFESLHGEALASMKKRFNRPPDYPKVFEVLRRHHIAVLASIIVGFENETPADVRRTADYFIERKAALASFFPLSPLPGTALYERFCKRDGCVDDNWWLGDGENSETHLFPAIRYKSGVVELLALHQEGMHHFYSRRSIAKRLPTLFMNNGMPLVLNLAYRRAVRRTGLVVL